MKCAKTDVNIVTEIINAPNVRAGRQRVGMAYHIRLKKKNATFCSALSFYPKMVNITTTIAINMPMRYRPIIASYIKQPIILLLYYMQWFLCRVHYRHKKLCSICYQRHDPELVYGRSYK